MNLAIFHYHLNPGGVTQVVRNQLLALAAAGGEKWINRVVILYGGRRDGWAGDACEHFGKLNPTLVAIPELEYDADPPIQDSLALATRIRATLQRHELKPDDTLLHVHNHALGKNVSLPGALAQQAEAGYRLLLQIHDFAEDLRPDNYRRLHGLACAGSNLPGSPGTSAGPCIYPQATHIHYAVLNSRDRGILARAGVVPSRLHLLPNPVALFGTLPRQKDARTKFSARFGIAADRQLLLYPVRGIRRKNVGELVLWAVLAGSWATTAITLRPRNPTEAASYDRWATLAGELDLPCLFGVGDDGGLEFAENLAAADAILTTSVAEGFGMVFLEAWLAGRQLVGRDLPEITADFTSVGMQLPGMYDRLAIPLTLVDEGKAREALRETYTATCRAYGQSPKKGVELQLALDQVTADGTIDFALLSGKLQAELIRRAVAETKVREALIALNPAFQPPERSVNPEYRVGATISKNAAAITEHFGLIPIGRRLQSIYRTIFTENIQTPLEVLPFADTILQSFLDPERLPPIRLEP